MQNNFTPWLCLLTMKPFPSVSVLYKSETLGGLNTFLFPFFSADWIFFLFLQLGYACYVVCIDKVYNFEQDIFVHTHNTIFVFSVIPFTAVPLRQAGPPIGLRIHIREVCWTRTLYVMCVVRTFLSELEIFSSQGAKQKKMRKRLKVYIYIYGKRDFFLYFKLSSPGDVSIKKTV